MIRRISSDQIPYELKEQLKILKKEVKDYVMIGDSYYEIRPLSVIKIINLINELISIINEAKKSDDQELKELTEGITSESSKPISIYDIFANETLKNKLIDLIWKLFDGIDRVDFESMNIAQFNELLDKIWQVNINAFPDEKAKKDFIQKMVSIILMINPNIYRFSMAQQFMDDLNIVLSRNPELSKQINEELRKLYEERMKETKH